MKGTIKFDVDGLMIGVHKNMTNLHKMEKLILLDSMAEVLELDAEERLIIGLTVATGGLKNYAGELDISKIEIDASKIKEMLKREGSAPEDLTSAEK